MARDGQQRALGTGDAPGTTGTTAESLFAFTGKGAPNAGAGAGGNGGGEFEIYGAGGASAAGTGGTGGSFGRLTGHGGDGAIGGNGGDSNVATFDGGIGSVGAGGRGGRRIYQTGAGGAGATIGGTGGDTLETGGTGGDGATGGAGAGFSRTAGAGGTGTVGAGGAGGSITETAGDAGASAAGGAAGGDYSTDAGTGSGTGANGVMNIGVNRASQVNLSRLGADTVRGGSVRVPIATTAIALLLSKSHEVVEVSAAATITLPSAAGISGRRYSIVNTGTGLVTVDAAGVETIDGQLTQLLTTQWDSITIVANVAGNGWDILSDTRSSEAITGNVVLKVFADSTYTALPSDWLIKYDATGGNSVVALPTAVGIKGKQYIIKKIDVTANTVTILPNGAQTIDGITPIILAAQWDSITIVSDGANWMEV